MTIWWLAYIHPSQRFEPLPARAFHVAVNKAREAEIRRELVDTDWPSPWWERQEEERSWAD